MVSQESLLSIYGSFFFFVRDWDYNAKRRLLSDCANASSDQAFLPVLLLKATFSNVVFFFKSFIQTHISNMKWCFSDLDLPEQKVSLFSCSVYFLCVWISIICSDLESYCFMLFFFSFFLIFCLLSDLRVRGVYIHDYPMASSG